MVGSYKHQTQSFQKASKEHETDKEELKKSVEEKDQKLSEMEAKLCLHKREQRQLREKVQELQMSLESSRQECEDLKKDFILSIAEKEQCLFTQKREHETDKDELKKSAEEKDQKLSEMEARLCLQKREHEKMREADEKAVQKLQMSLVCSTQAYEALQNKSKKLEKYGGICDCQSTR